MSIAIQHQLIDQCKQNDRKAQLQLYQQYCDAMFCIAHRLLNNVHDAEDVMQEAFVKAFQKIEQYKGDVTFGAWLKKIVVNTCLDALKSKKRRSELEKESGTEVIAEDSNWEVENTVTINEIKKAIFTLPDKYKEVIMLYLIEGYNHEEIAQILDITTVTSRSRLLRGKQKLKLLLKHQYYGSGY